MKLAMQRVQIVGLKGHLEETVRVLHDLGCLQIEPPTTDNADVKAFSPTPEMVQRQEEVGLLVAQIESLLTTFGASFEPAQVALTALPGDECITLARDAVTALAPRVRTLVQQREELEAEQISLPRYEATLRRLLPIVPPAAQVAGRASTVVLVSRSHRWVLDSIRLQVHELAGDDAELFETDVGGDMTAMLIIVPRDRTMELENLLGHEDISRLRLPEGIAAESPDVAVARLKQRMAAIPAESTQLAQQLEALAAQHTAQLQIWRACLRDRLAELNVVQRLGETRYTFVLQGWTPARDVARIAERLRQTVGEAVQLDVVELGPEGGLDAPVALVNPAPAQPFERLVGLLSWPRPRDIDPTILTALFLPLFYGMILGDIGYGLLLLLLALLLLRRFRQPGAVRDILRILAIGAGWGIIFGILYGEAFGTVGEELGLHPIWISRFEPEDVAVLLLFTVAVGAVHVTLGLILGVWQAWQARSRSHLLERGGMLVGLVGLFLLVSVLTDYLPSSAMTPSYALLLLGVVLLGSSYGWLGVLLGPIEFISLLGNILSYLRIAAVGLASVYVALVANELGGALGTIIVGALIAVLIHALNLALGAFSPSIHSLRLHYVEFFGKFYGGGGRRFEPFRSRRATLKHT